MGSFLRKYSALTGFSIKQMKKFFVFRPVTMGSPVNIAGAEFRFFYAFHSIPTIGFEINFCGKSIYFSADTFYNPAALKDIYLKGIFFPPP
jgi:phosphoribosyl 1,2-cyclic phosphodiesterase